MVRKAFNIEENSLMNLNEPGSFLLIYPYNPQYGKIPIGSFQRWRLRHCDHIIGSRYPLSRSSIQSIFNHLDFVTSKNSGVRDEFHHHWAVLGGTPPVHAWDPENRLGISLVEHPASVMCQLYPLSHLPAGALSLSGRTDHFIRRDSDRVQSGGIHHAGLCLASSTSGCPGVQYQLHAQAHAGLCSCQRLVWMCHFTGTCCSITELPNLYRCNRLYDHFPPKSERWD